MSVKMKNVLMACGILFALAVPGTGYAQMDNRPFSFKNSPGGLGMSQGGRQAILGAKLLGETPNTLLRNYNGELLELERGPGKSAIVRRQDGSFLPGYRGEDFRGGNEDMRVGVFNPFFSPVYTGDDYYPPAALQTAAMIDAWVGALVAGELPFPYYDVSNSVTSWTGFVNYLQK